MRATHYLPLLALCMLGPGALVTDERVDSTPVFPDRDGRVTVQQRVQATQGMREVLRRYIRGCNTGDTALLTSTLAEDVTVYFLNLPPVRGRDAVVKAWKDYHDAARARWSIDHVVIEGDEAVMEWSALRDQRLGPHGFDRGIDWYVFRGGVIAEIRQYYDSRGVLPVDRIYEQMGFPYSQRGYPTAATLEARLP